MFSVKCVSTALAGIFFEYTTPKIVTVRSVKIGFLNRLIQITIVVYIVGYAIVYKKGYQQTDVAQSSVVSKVKGVASTINRSDLTHLQAEYRKIWDTSDYVIPAQESDAFFVLTNAIITPRQTQGQCPEDTTTGFAFCSPTNNTCRKGVAVHNGNGVMTGRCVNSTRFEPSRPATQYTCEIEAWCPTEHDSLNRSQPLLPEAENFTVMIKNYIQFPILQTSRRNILSSVNNASYLQHCVYDEESNPYCPIFQLGDIVRLTGNSFLSMAVLGGIIEIRIRWDCNLDFNVNYCKPQYSFSRLDNEKVQLSPGWNFRYSNKYREYNGTEFRDLYKVYGILFKLTVNGVAGKFHVVPLAINIGSGIALLGLVGPTVLVHTYR